MRFAIALSLLIACLLSAGCGSGKDGTVTIKGKVTDNGQPVHGSAVPAQIQFRRYEGERSATSLSDSRIADLQNDGTYEIALMPGEYSIVVQQFDKYMGPNKLESVFPLDKSPLVKKFDASGELNIEVNEYRNKGS